MRVGVVVAAQEFLEARRPALKLEIDFGPKRFGPFVSEVLVLGAYDSAGEVVLLAPDLDVAPGSRIG